MGVELHVLEPCQQILFATILQAGNSGSMNKKGSIKKRFVIVVPEALHYRLKSTALRERTHLNELVKRYLWNGLKDHREP